MTKMASMPLNGKNPSKDLRNQKAYDLETWYSIQYLGLGPYIVCSNDDPRLTFFTARSNLLPNAFVWENA